MISQEQFTFEKKYQTWALGLIGVGVLSLLIGIFMYAGSNPTRIWANILLDGWYFTVISLTAVFFVAVNYVAKAGWHTAFKRVPEAMGAYLPIGGFFMLIIVLGVFMHWHGIYHWSHDELFDPASEHYDPLIAGKKAFLNKPFFIIRFVLYFLIWIVLYNIIRKLSIKEDAEANLSYHKKSIIYSGLFVIIYAATTSTTSWDYIMSIDTHWFSTLFGWYNFATMFAATLATITLIVVNLKKQGYLSLVNENHFHDMGKFMFAFTVFWGYLWFSQYMLIWYANIPEETIYYFKRFEQFKFLFFLNLFLNFFIPFLTLMDRDAKRNPTVLTVAGIIMIIGHWLDYYLMIMPGTVGENYGIGILEIGLFIGFAGLFGLVVGKALTKASLTPANHPFLEESIHHHV